jgi:hypothetical protein
MQNSHCDHRKFDSVNQTHQQMVKSSSKLTKILLVLQEASWLTFSEICIHPNGTVFQQTHRQIGTSNTFSKLQVFSICLTGTPLEFQHSLKDFTDSKHAFMRPKLVRSTVIYSSCGWSLSKYVLQAVPRELNTN